jgi:hypothetical protein
MPTTWPLEQVTKLPYIFLYSYVYILHQILLYHMAAVCVNKCPDDTDYTQFICYDDVQASANNDTKTAWELVGDGKCLFHVKTKSCEFL